MVEILTQTHTHTHTSLNNSRKVPGPVRYLTSYVSYYMQLIFGTDLATNIK